MVLVHLSQEQGHHCEEKERVAEEYIYNRPAQHVVGFLKIQKHNRIIFIALLE